MLVNLIYRDGLFTEKKLKTAEVFKQEKGKE